VNYTWAYNASTNVWMNESGGTAPPASDQWAMAYDPSGGYVVAFGGGSNLTWAYQHGVWTELHPALSPPARDLPCMTYDSEDQYVLLFGGSASSSYSTVLNDTWSFSDGSWTNRTLATAPPGGGGCSLSTDAQRSSVVEFGGWAHPADFDPTTNETWEYRAGQWAEISSNNTPTGRYGGMMAFVPDCGCDLLFGGFFFYGSSGGGGEGVLGDTWLLQDGQWNRFFPSPSPPVRGTAPFAVDPALGVVILFGGFDYSGLDSDTWSFTNPLSLSLLPSSLQTAEVGQSDTLALEISGGEAPFNVTWSGLPGECAQVVGNTAYCQMSAPTTVAVVAVASDARGYDAVLEFSLEVLPALEVNASSSTNATDVLAAVDFQANATAGLPPYSYVWAFSDGPADTGASVSHSFGSTGPTFATVTVTDALDVTSSATVPVEVAPIPTLTITTNASPSVIDGPITLNASVSGGTGPFNVTWSLGDGETEQGLSVTHDYAAAGRFIVTANVTDGVGSHATNTTVVTVSASSSPAAGAPTGVLTTVLLGISLLAVGIPNFPREQRALSDVNGPF
jgi:hypothetical protein